MRLKKGDRVVFLDRDSEVVMRKAKTGRLSETLEEQKAWAFTAVEFQKKLRKEWD